MFHLASGPPAIWKILHFPRYFGTASRFAVAAQFPGFRRLPQRRRPPWPVVAANRNFRRRRRGACADSGAQAPPPPRYGRQRSRLSGCRGYGKNRVNTTAKHNKPAGSPFSARQGEKRVSAERSTACQSGGNRKRARLPQRRRAAFCLRIEICSRRRSRSSGARASTPFAPSSAVSTRRPAAAGNRRWYDQSVRSTRRARPRCPRRRPRHGRLVARPSIETPRRRAGCAP